MPAAPFTTVAIEGDVAAALAAIPARAGVAQFLGPEGRNLLIGRPANLRRWAASHLGAGKPPRKGARPPTDLRPVAAAFAHAPTTSPFHQRLVFERLMARHVPAAARRDLPRPAYLHLDPGERFPRVTVRPAPGDREALFGPFRDRRGAEKAIKELHKLYPLRPCDFVFEPDPALPLGLGCVYAQVRTCAAPCLSRVTEDAYRALAGDGAAFLARPASRPEAVAAWLPRWVAAARGSHGLVVELGSEGVELYPVRDGAVLEAAATCAPAADLDAAVGRLEWPAGGRPDDTPWLAGWLQAPRRSGAFLVVEDPCDHAGLVERVRAALDAAARVKKASGRADGLPAVIP